MGEGTATFKKIVGAVNVSEGATFKSDDVEGDVEIDGASSASFTREI